MNLVYGSYAPTAAHVFIDDEQFQQLWESQSRWYIFAKEDQLEHLKSLAGKDGLITVKSSGGEYLLTNRPIDSANSEFRADAGPPGTTDESD